MGPWPLPDIAQKIKKGELPADCVVHTQCMVGWQPFGDFLPLLNGSGACRNWNLRNAFTTCLLCKYADFSGRASRAEYWWYMLAQNIILLPFLVLCMIAPEWESLPLPVLLAYALYLLATLLPNLAVTVRRLHDTGRGGWWVAMLFIPCVGNIISLLIFVFTCLPSTGSNQYGLAPSLPAKR